MSAYRIALLSLTVLFSSLSVKAQLFGKSDKSKSSSRRQYEVKSSTRSNVKRQTVGYDGMPEDTTASDNSFKSAMSKFKEKLSRSKDKESSSADTVSKKSFKSAIIGFKDKITGKDSASIAEDIEKESNTRRYTYKSISLNQFINVDSLMSNPVPFDGFKLLITDMQNYSKGDDIRLVDDHGLVVTVVLDSISDKVTGILVGNIDEMYDVRQIQTSVKRQMGEPSMGYEVIRNYDGDNNSVWTDYSTFEFVYRYNIGYTTYDFHLSQVGAAMKNNHVVHPYNFSAIVTRRVDKQLSVNQQQAIQQSLGDGNTVVDGSLKTGEGFYPKEGTARYDDCSIETKVLTKW